mmetsp:Transcript_79980/g.205767  ORF Transcript_79980/g.205767 Transcript_79980/m.205767 type:complete len:433 (-) Transcript_79980:44-1342(-)
MWHGCNVQSIDHTVAVRPLPEDFLALILCHALHHLGHLAPTILDEILEVVDALLKATLRRHLLRNAAVDVRDAGPEDRAQRHEVWLRGAVDVAALQVVGLQLPAGRADGVDLRSGRGVAALVHCVVRLREHLAILHDDCGKGLALLRLAQAGALLRCGDGEAHHLLMAPAQRLVRRHQRRGWRLALTREDLHVRLAHLRTIAAAEAAAHGPVHAGVREELHAVVVQQAIVDLDHVLAHALLALLAPRAGVSDVTTTRDAIAAGLCIDLVVEDLVIEAILRRGVPVHTNVDAAQASPLHSTPAHGARLTGGVELAVREVMGAERFARLLDRVHLRMPRGVLQVQHHVVRAGDDDTVPHDGAAEGAAVTQAHASKRGASGGLHEGLGNRILLVCRGLLSGDHGSLLHLLLRGGRNSHLDGDLDIVLRGHDCGRG